MCVNRLALYCYAECYRLVGHEFGGSAEVSVLEDSFGERFFECIMCAAPIQWSMLFSVVQSDDRILLREVVNLLKVGFHQ